MSLYQKCNLDYASDNQGTRLGKSDNSSLNFNKDDHIGYTMINNDPNPIYLQSSLPNARSLASSFSRVNPQSFQEGRTILKPKKPVLKKPTSSLHLEHNDLLQMKRQLSEIMARPNYDMGYICKKCNLAMNGHNSIQQKHPHEFIAGEYRKLLPFEYGPWWPGGYPYLN